MAGYTVRTSGGVGLHVEQDGDPAAPVTVLLLHGWTLDHRSWGPVAAALTASAGVRAGGSDRPPVRVVRYDHRAHGRSDLVARPDMTIEALADDLAEVVGQVAPVGPLVLAGHSMGGMTIMALAERHPELVAERVRGVALVSTAAGGLADTTLGLSARMVGLVRRGEARLARAAWVDRRRMLSRRPALIAPGARALLLGRGADRGALRVTGRCLADCRPSTLVGFRPTLDAHDRDAALAAFRGVPVEVVVGSRDRLTPVAQSRRIVAAAPGARLTVFPGAGHMVPLERVLELTLLLKGLVNGVATEAGGAFRGTREDASAGAASAPEDSVVHHREVGQSAPGQP